MIVGLIGMALGGLALGPLPPRRLISTGIVKRWGRCAL